MEYVDTSILVSAFMQEKRSRDMRRWLSEHDVGALVVSDWVITEFSAALSMKLRLRVIDNAQRTHALASFSTFRSKTLRIVSVSGRHFQIATQFADVHDSGIRAADALHLAIASDANSTLCTIDRGLADAGSVLGVPTRLL